MRETKVKRRLKNQKAITLIALVITIIVLLILATVTISALTGDNGIITRAVESKKQIEYQNAFEEVKIAVMTTRMDYELKNKLLSISEECASDIETELKKNSPEGTVYLEDYSMYAKNRGYVFEVTEEFGINEIMIEGDTSLWVQEDGVIIAYNGDISELDGGTLVIPNYVGGVKITELKSELFYNKIQEPLQVNLKISNGIKKIGSSCFSNCNGLIGTLDIPNSVTYLDGAAFYGCTGFTGNLIIPSSVTYIGGGAFYGCTGFTGDLAILNSVETIVGESFKGCTGLDGKLTIGMKDIPSGFYINISGTNFTELDILEGVETIGTQAFYNCTGFIGNLTIPNSVTYIGATSFYGCTGFSGDLTIPNSVTTIETNSFSNCTGLNGKLTIGMKDIPSGFIYNNISGTNFTELEILEGVETIETQAFENCTGFTGNLTIPSSVTYIGGGAFNGCTGFDGKLTIGKEDISSYFAASTLSNTKFTELELLDGVTSVGDGAFSSLTSLTLVRIPSSVSSMGSEAMAIGVSGVSKLIYVDGWSYRPDGWDEDWVNYYYDPDISTSAYKPYAWYTYSANKKDWHYNYNYNLYYYVERRYLGFDRCTKRSNCCCMGK